MVKSSDYGEKVGMSVEMMMMVSAGVPRPPLCTKLAF
jgi:hypothetical protein